MPVVVSFCRPRNLAAAPVINKIRARETLTVPAVTTAAGAEDGDCAVVANTDAVPVLVAHGTTPDAQATTSTAATTAGVVVQPGQTLLLMLDVGSKVGAKAVV